MPPSRGQPSPGGISATPSSDLISWCPDPPVSCPASVSTGCHDVGHAIQEVHLHILVYPVLSVPVCAWVGSLEGSALISLEYLPATPPLEDILPGQFLDMYRLYRFSIMAAILVYFSGTSSVRTVYIPHSRCPSHNHAHFSCSGNTDSCLYHCHPSLVRTPLINYPLGSMSVNPADPLPCPSGIQVLHRTEQCLRHLDIVEGSIHPDLTLFCPISRCLVCWWLLRGYVFPPDAPGNIQPREGRTPRSCPLSVCSYHHWRGWARHIRSPHGNKLASLSCQLLSWLRNQMPWYLIFIVLLELCGVANLTESKEKERISKIKKIFSSITDVRTSFLTFRHISNRCSLSPLSSRIHTGRPFSVSVSCAERPPSWESFSPWCSARSIPVRFSFSSLVQGRYPVYGKPSIREVGYVCRRWTDDCYGLSPSPRSAVPPHRSIPPSMMRRWVSNTECRLHIGVARHVRRPGPGIVGHVVIVHAGNMQRFTSDSVSTSSSSLRFRCPPPRYAVPSPHLPSLSISSTALCQSSIGDSLHHHPPSRSRRCPLLASTSGVQSDIATTLPPVGIPFGQGRWISCPPVPSSSDGRHRRRKPYGRQSAAQQCEVVSRDVAGVCCRSTYTVSGKFRPIQAQSTRIPLSGPPAVRRVPGQSPSHTRLVCRRLFRRALFHRQMHRIAYPVRRRPCRRFQSRAVAVRLSEPGRSSCPHQDISPPRAPVVGCRRPHDPG